MKDLMAPRVTVTLNDGKEYSLLFDYEALASIDAALDLPDGANTLSLKFWANISAKKIFVVLWAAMLYGSPDLKLEDVKRLCRGLDPNKLTEHVLRAWGASTPEVKKGEKDETAQNPLETKEL